MAAQDELMLVERVFLRVVSAETDEQLQAALFKFLAPLLLKLTSQADGVRKKVMELLVHINKRVKCRPLIQLPIKELLAQYQDPAADPFVTNFTIVYIKMGFPRQEAALQAELAPSLLKCVEGRPQPQQDSLLQLAVRALPHITWPADHDKRKAMFHLDEQPAISKLMLEYMMDILLMPYNYGQSSSPSNQSQGAAGAQAPQGKSPPPPGLCESALKRINGDNPLSAAELEKVKLGILGFLGADILLAQDVVCHLVVALADARHSVANLADRELKRIVGNQDWNNPAIIFKLYSIFQGTVVIKGQPTVKPDKKRTPANIQLRLKIFPYFLKSKEAANHFPACVQVVFDCLYGTNTNARLKTMAVQFVHHMCLVCADVKFNPISSVLLSGMVKLIGESKEDPKLRSLAYVGVGKIAKRLPQLVSKDVGLLQTFFDAMCKEESENRLAIQEALSMMAAAFKNLDTAKLKLMEALIMQNIEKPEPQARLMAVQYAKTVFPPDNIPSRYVLLLACGDTKEDIYGEASQALRGAPKPEEPEKVEGKEAKLEQQLLPSFVDMVNYIHDKATQRLKSQQKYVMGNNILAFNPGTYGEILMYLRMCLGYNAGSIPNLESTQTMQEQAPSVRQYVNQLLQEQPGDKGPISVYIGIIRQLLTAIGGAPAMYCLLEIVAVAREKLAPQFVKHLDWIKGFVMSSREEMREFAAQLYALVVAEGESEKRHLEVLQELISGVQNQSLEGQHGCALCLGYLMGHLLAKSRRKLGDVEVEDMETGPSDNGTLHKALVKTLKQIAGLLDSSQAVLSGAACAALGEIGRNGALPLPNSSKDAKTVSKLSIVENLVKKVQSMKDSIKVREKAAVNLGYLCVGEPDFPHRKTIITGLLDCAQAKQFELHFTVGEGLVCAALGPASPAARDMWTTTEEEFKVSQCSSGKDEVETLLTLLLEKYTVSPNPHIRQAACVWLLSLVKTCGSHRVLQAKLKEIQAAFMGLLADSDEITQDIASKGLGVVYENSGKEQKEELVSNLVDTLTTGRRKQTQVTGDTQVFQEGAIGKTPDGQSLNTYRELCSIASDLNQPDLVYKFMHLANHNAMWNSRKGAAFGFTGIAAQAGEQLAPYMRQIVPKLYRYQFDPNPKVNLAMTSIWNALVKDSKKTVDKYLKEIMEDLIKNLTNNQWRIRESSCLAVYDLLRGRQLDDIIGQLPVLWETLFRVRDDIKESVRKAADTAVRSLSRVSIKICDANYGKVGEEATSLVLPCLLKTGLSNPVQEIRALSLTTITKMSKNAGRLLKPHVPLLVVALLEALSELEPQMLNYVSLHVASNQQAQDRLDNARIAASKTSPMMETINLCVQHVDPNILSELVPRLTELIRSGIGLGTKAGCANFIISLTHQCPRDLEPHAGKLLGSLLNGLNDRNPTVRKCYASAIGHLVKVGKDSSVEKLIGRLKAWYMEKEEGAVRLACGQTLQAINQRNPDVLKRHAALALPLAFLAMHEKNENDTESSSDKSLSSWEEVWLDATPGTEAGIRLYLTELVEITQTALGSQSWHMKAQAAATMNKMAAKLGSNLGPPHLGLLLSALVSGLAGRTWTGKEALLQAISSVCVSCKEVLSEADSEDQPTVPQVLEAVLKECRKESIPYKMEALRCLTAILEAHDVDRYKELSDILYPMLTKDENKKGDKVEDDPDIDKNTRLEFQECAFICLGQAWPTNQDSQTVHQESLCSLLSKTLNTSTWKVEVSLLKACHKFIKRLKILQSSELISSHQASVTSMLGQLTPPLCQSLGNAKYTAVRSEALEVTELLITRLSDRGQLGLMSEEWKTALEGLSSDSQPQLQDKAVTLLKTLNAGSGTT